MDPAARKEPVAVFTARRLLDVAFWGACSFIVWAIGLFVPALDTLSAARYVLLGVAFLALILGLRWWVNPRLAGLVYAVALIAVVGSSPLLLWLVTGAVWVLLLIVALPILLGAGLGAIFGTVR